MMPAVARGLCQCGCGEPTKISTRDDARLDVKKGQPFRFIKGHQRRGGTRHLNPQGYVVVLAVGHPRGVGRGWVLEHIVVAERALGRALPAGAVVHHVNGDRADNRPSNLVILQDQKEHLALHLRQRVRDAGGNPFTQRLCCACHQPKPFDEFYRPVDRERSTQCKACARRRALERARRRAS